MSSSRPEIQARLDHVCMRSPDPERLAKFFELGYGMTMVRRPGAPIECRATERRILIQEGRPNLLAYFAYAFASDAALGEYRKQLGGRGVRLNPNPSPLFERGAFAAVDPDGNSVVFGVRDPVAAAASPSAPLPGRLQHAVFRSTRLDQMVEFYSKQLGFVVSDRVQDPAGALTACFMRSDAEHHSIAVFRSPETRMDHLSFETTNWEFIRRWADDLAKKRIPIFWGVGRHGPGDDLFFMVKDPDDNLIEISAEIEQCPADRPMGIWPHEQRTLNVWGNAIMRS